MLDLFQYLQAIALLWCEMDTICFVMSLVLKMFPVRLHGEKIISISLTSHYHLIFLLSLMCSSL